MLMGNTHHPKYLEAGIYKLETRRSIKLRTTRLEQVKQYLWTGQYTGARDIARGRPHRRLNEGIHALMSLPLQMLVRLPWVTDRAKEEAHSISVTRTVIELRRLPPAFDGMTIAFLTDLHCSRITPPSFLARVVDETNRLKPDLILLGGDYVTRGAKYAQPVAEVLRQLAAPLGCYGVLGNHDCRYDPEAIRQALKQAGIVDVTNSGHWLALDGSRIRIAGVGDLWEDEQDLGAALSGTRANDVAILLSHNPDFSMELADPRVGLVLSGHTHGGQIRLPGVGPVITNSKYGKHLASGLVSFGSFQLYVSRGLGTVLVPLRYQCPPEVALLTLRKV